MNRDRLSHLHICQGFHLRWVQRHWFFACCSGWRSNPRKTWGDFMSSRWPFQVSFYSSAQSSILWCAVMSSAKRTTYFSSVPGFDGKKPCTPWSPHVSLRFQGPFEDLRRAHCSFSRCCWGQRRTNVEVENFPASELPKTSLVYIRRIMWSLWLNGSQWKSFRKCKTTPCMMCEPRIKGWAIFCGGLGSIDSSLAKSLSQVTAHLL